MHSTIRKSSTFSDSTNYSLPLTKENLRYLEKYNHKNELLERYCQDMTSFLNKNTMDYSNRPQSTPPMTRASNDLVVASPRILPFPYHNDSLFLPTAEQIQYHINNSSQQDAHSCLSTSRAESTTTTSQNDYSLLSRPHSTTNAIGCSSSITQQYERRSLPTKLDHQSMSRKFKRFYSGASISSSISEEDEIDAIEEKKKKRPWLKRIKDIFEIIKHNKKANKNQHHQSVWYCQYSENPSL